MGIFFFANGVYYCHHFPHFSSPGIKLRKLSWFPKYLVNFYIEQLKIIAVNMLRTDEVRGRFTGSLSEDRATLLALPAARKKVAIK